MTDDDLRAVAVRLGLTQVAMAAMLNVSLRTVCRWWRGEQAVPDWVGPHLELREEMHAMRAEMALLRARLDALERPAAAKPKGKRPTKAQLRRRADLAQWQWARRQAVH